MSTETMNPLDAVRISSAETQEAIAAATPKYPDASSIFTVSGMTSDCISKTMQSTQKIRVGLPNRVIDALTRPSPVDLVLLTFRQKLANGTITVFRPAPLRVGPVPAENPSQEISKIASSVMNSIVYYILEKDPSSKGTWAVDIELTQNSSNKFGVLPS